MSPWHVPLITGFVPFEARRRRSIDALQMTMSPGDSVGGGSANKANGEAAAPEQRDRFIPLRKSDIVDGLLAEGRLDAAQQAELRQFARMLGLGERRPDMLLRFGRGPLLPRSLRRPVAEVLDQRGGA